MTEKRKIILIVDDQDSIREALQICLSSWNYNILSASNGHDALELIANKKDDDDIVLIISDKRMPQMTGVQLFQQTMDILPDAIRVLMSGYGDSESIAEAIKRGVVHRFLVKPWDMDESNTSSKAGGI